MVLLVEWRLENSKKKKGIRFAPLFLTLFLFCALAPKSSSQSFKCSSTTTCFSLIDYVSPNDITLSNIKTLFSVRSFRSFLGANNLPLSTSPNHTVAAKQALKVPFPCICSNGTGISNRKPLYTIQKDDSLYHIAAEVFAGLVVYQDIAKVNNISDPNKILEGDSLWIPLPCSCDDVDGEEVVHYGHVVETGSSLEAIAVRYGTTQQALSQLNNGVTDAKLLAGQVLDVPLQACNSSVQDDSEDYPFLLANNTYVVTANGCVKCKCDVSTNNQRVQCEPSGIRPTNWTTCPAMQCENSLSLGNSTSSGCNTRTCAYAGYSKNQTQIFTTLTNDSTCPADTPSNSPPGSTTPGSDASRIVWSCNFLFIATYLLLL